MHSHKIDPSELNGEPAVSMQEFLSSPHAEKVDEIRALPFFLGPSLAITDWLPKNLKLWKDKLPSERKFRILKPLYEAGDARLVQALSDLCRNVVKRASFSRPHVALVDHGTPLVEVNQVREECGEGHAPIDWLRSKFPVFPPVPWNAGPTRIYDFNDPLLENLTRPLGCGMAAREVVVISQFFSPPRQACRARWGPGANLPAACDRSGIRRLPGPKTWATHSFGPGRYPARADPRRLAERYRILSN